jgi:predicted  nucleic acid-binding Zn-ribbon protein
VNTLENIDNLIDSLTDRVRELLDEREILLTEVAHLRARLMERDRDAVKVTQEMQVALEEARVNMLRLEQERTGIESKLQGLNDRLVTLVKERHRG